MVIVNLLRGGLGNQLFQYSATFSLARRLGFEIEHETCLLPEREDTLGEVSRWPEQISAFNFSGDLRRESNQPPYRTSLRSKILTSRILTAKALRSLKIENYQFIDDDNIDDLLSIPQEQISHSRLYMHGYFQSTRFFEGHKSEIYNQVSNLRQPSEEYVKLMNSMNFSIPAIHLRLGDKAMLDVGYTQRKIASLKMVLERFDLRASKLRVFTDTPSFFLQNSTSLFRNSEIFYSNDLVPLEHLLLLASHEFIVGSDSSFFWWASALQQHHKPRANYIVY